MSIKPKALEAPATNAPAPSQTFEKTVEGLKQSAATATASLEQAQAQLKQGYERAVKTAEQFAQFHQGNIEALVKASQIWATGLQDLSKHFAATEQSQIDETVATVKALSSVKSLKEAMDLQSSLAKTAMEKMVAETGKISDASMKLAEQTIAPLTARVTLAAEKFGKTV